MKTLARALLLSAVLGAAAPGLAEAEGHDQVAAAALQAFDSGQLDKAAADYEQLVKDGVVNGHLYYNLGVIYFKEGRVGDAVAAFLGARRYLPRDPDTEANLRFALGKIHDKLEAAVPSSAAAKLAFWMHRCTALELAWFTAVLGALWGVAMLATLWPSLQRWRWPAVVSGALPALALAGFLAKDAAVEAWAAINQPEAKVYSGPGSQNTQLFALQEGAPVLITERAAGGYYRIKLSDGKQGWVADNQVRLFGPL